MKKRMYVAAALILCAGLLVAAAFLRDGSPKNTDPDKARINDTQNPYDANKPGDLAAPVTHEPSAQNDNGMPNDTTPPAQDDSKDPAKSKQPDDGTKPKETKYSEVYRHPDNEKALQAYYDFLKNNGKARLVGETRELTLSETFEIMYAKAHDEFAFFDFGSNGVQELAIKTYHE